MKRQFKRHFRIYFRNGHPAYIIDEDGNKYIFHRVTHSKTSGGKKNWIKKPNPLKGDNKPMGIVRREEKDMKGRFSLFELEIKPGMNIDYPDIKKAGGSQTNQDLEVKVANNITTSKPIKTKKQLKCNKSKCRKIKNSGNFKRV